MKRYVSMYPSLVMTARKCDQIVRVKFRNGVFETEDPDIQAAIEGSIHFGSQVREASGDVVEKKEPAPQAGKPHIMTNHDPLLEVVMKEQVNAKKARKTAKKASKEKGSK